MINQFLTIVKVAGCISSMQTVPGANLVFVSGGENEYLAIKENELLWASRTVDEVVNLSELEGARVLRAGDALKYFGPANASGELFARWEGRTLEVLSTRDFSSQGSVTFPKDFWIGVPFLDAGGNYILGSSSVETHPGSKRGFVFDQAYLFDVQAKGLSRLEGITSMEGGLSAVWNAGLNSFVVLDSYYRRMWSCSAASKKVVVLAEKTDEQVHYVVSPSGERVVRFSELDGKPHMATGVIEPDRINWSDCVPAPQLFTGEKVTWHPSRDLLGACSGKSAVRGIWAIQVVDLTGGIVEECSVSCTSASPALAWSGDGSSMFIAGEKQITVWKVFNR